MWLLFVSNQKRSPLSFHFVSTCYSNLKSVKSTDFGFPASLSVSHTGTVRLPVAPTWWSHQPEARREALVHMVSCPLQSLDEGRDKHFGLPPTVTALGASRGRSLVCSQTCVCVLMHETEPGRKRPLNVNVWIQTNTFKPLCFSVLGTTMFHWLQLSPRNNEALLSAKMIDVNLFVRLTFQRWWKTLQCSISIWLKNKEHKYIQAIPNDVRIL